MKHLLFTVLLVCAGCGSGVTTLPSTVAPATTDNSFSPEITAACSTLHADSTIAGIIMLTEEAREDGSTKNEQLTVAQLTCSEFCNGNTVCEESCLVCHVAVIDAVYPFSDTGTTSCPFELDNGVGFSLTIPCGFDEVDPEDSPTPGATYHRVYASTDLLLGVAVFPPSQAQVALPDELISIQFNGPVTTATGDFLLNMNAEGSGFEGEKAIGMLANGDFLSVTVAGSDYDQDIQIVAASVFLSIDLKDTDGSGYIDFLAESASALQAPPTDGYVVLEDDSVWKVSGATDASTAVLWEADDLVLHQESQGVYDDVTLVNMSSWQSVEAEYSGIGSRAIVAGFNDPEFGSKEIVLDDGTVLASSYTDESKLLHWEEGDPVTIVYDASISWTYVINLRTGQAVWIP